MYTKKNKSKNYKSIKNKSIKNKNKILIRHGGYSKKRLNIKNLKYNKSNINRKITIKKQRGGNGGEGEEIEMILLSSSEPLDIDITDETTSIESTFGDIVELDIGTFRSNELEFNTLLGAGNFGVVKKYIYKNKFIYGGQNVSVAIKEVLPTTDIIELDREIELIRKIPKHTNLVEFIGVITINGMKGIMLDYCELGDLHKLLINIPIFNRLVEEDYLLKIIKDIASGMESLHVNEILHCDLAARNVLISGSLNRGITARIADFGLSIQLEEIDPVNTVFGTIRIDEGILKALINLPLRWCHPKAIQELTFNKQTDIWSFACTIVEILDRGLYPFGAKSNDEIVEHLRNPSLYGKSILNKMNVKLTYSLQEKHPRMLAFIVKCLTRTSQTLSFSELIHNLDTIQDIQNIYAANTIKGLTLFRYPEGYNIGEDIGDIEQQPNPFENIQEDRYTDDGRRIRVIEPINPYPCPTQEQVDHAAEYAQAQSPQITFQPVFFSSCTSQGLYGQVNQ